MKVLGICGLTCSGKSSLVELLEEYSIRIELGDIIRRTFEINNFNEADVYDFTLNSHECFGKTWSLAKALDSIPTNYDGLVIFSGIRFLNQVKLLQLIDSDFKLIYIEADTQIRKDRFIRRNRKDSLNTIHGFEKIEKMEFENYDLPKLRKLSNWIIQNNGNINNLRDKFAALKNFDNTVYSK
jgi:dephospho-CoA kinase